MLALDKIVGDRIFGRLVERQRQRGFVLRDGVQAAETFEFLGMELSSRMAIYAARGAARGDSGSGYCRGKTCGHLCHHYGLFTPGLSVLQTTFRFAFEAAGMVVKLPRLVRDEIRVRLALLFAASSDWKDFGPIECTRPTPPCSATPCLHETAADGFMVGSVAR